MLDRKHISNYQQKLLFCGISHFQKRSIKLKLLKWQWRTLCNIGKKLTKKNAKPSIPKIQIQWLIRLQKNNWLMLISLTCRTNKNCLQILEWSRSILTRLLWQGKQCRRLLQIPEQNLNPFLDPTRRCRRFIISYKEINGCRIS